MNDKLEKLDLSDAAGKIRERIQAAFVEIIPTAQWQAMIEAEIKKFVEPTRIRQYVSHGDWVAGPSELEKLVLVEAQKRALALVQKVLAENEWFGDIGSTDPQFRVSVMVKQYLAENHHGIIQAALQAFVGTVVQAVIEQVRNQPRY